MRSVHSSQGTLEVDDTGKVTGIIYNGKTGPVTIDLETITYLLSIERFNLSEYAEYYGKEDDEEFDILDLGYWTTDGTYEPPVEEWRKQIEKELASRKEGE